MCGCGQRYQPPVAPRPAPVVASPQGKVAEPVAMQPAFGFLITTPVNITTSAPLVGVTGNGPGVPEEVALSEFNPPNVGG